MRRALAEPHKLVLAMHIAACVQAEAGRLNAAEWEHLLSSSPDLPATSKQSEAAADSPLGGLPQSAWEQIKGLECLSGFQVHVASKFLHYSPGPAFS